MPAQNPENMGKRETYCHIYNKGVEERKLYNDQEDYEVFLSYLADYLTTPTDKENTKKDFTVNGRTFRGIPHQPKNYFNKVELLAYNLMPNHFHLLVHEIVAGSLEKLIRSLCTRYAIYYNKKYQRPGSLFQGPYKSVQIEEVARLLYLTRHFHRESNGHSSYEDYLGDRVTSWVKPNVVFAYLDKAENDFYKGTNGYKNFVENHQLIEKEEEIIKKYILEEKLEQTEKRVFEPKEVKPVKPNYSEPVSVPKIKVIGFSSTSLVIFLLLFSLGIRNINTSAAQTKNAISLIPSPSPQVSGIGTALPTTAYLPPPTPEVAGTDTAQLINPEPSPIPEITEEVVNPESKSMVIIKINDGSESINLRQEPSTQSEIVGKAVDGDVFELISEAGVWYQIKLDDETPAFVSAEYVQLVECATCRKENNLIMLQNWYRQKGEYLLSRLL